MRIVFMGTPEAAVPSLRRLETDGHEVVGVWTQPDKPAGRGNKVAISPIKEFSISRGLKVYQPARIKTDDAKTLFTSLRADLAVVVAYGKILPAEFLSAPARGAINVHFSLLPLYRGAAPVNWAIVKGEEQTGVTTMFMEEKLDTGPILLQRKTTIGRKETAPELTERLAQMGADLLSETLAQLDSITPRVQRDSDATFAPVLRKEDGLIDWSNSAFAIERCLRGFQPWPNAYTIHNSRRLIIWNGEVVEKDKEGAVAGEIIAAHADDLIIRCGKQTALRVIEVQAEGKRRLSVRDFLNGTQLRVGDRFGQD